MGRWWRQLLLLRGNELRLCNRWHLLLIQLRLLLLLWLIHHVLLLCHLFVIR
jgi:hypothetical protein